MNWVDVEFGYEEGYRQGKLEAPSSVSLIGILFNLLFQLLILGIKLVAYIAIAFVQMIFYLFRKCLRK